MNAKAETTAGELVDMPEQANTAMAEMPRTESNAIMALIERAATSNDIDVDKLDKLLSVKERWDAQQAKREFDSAMSLFHSKAPTIERKAKGHNGKYAKLHHAIETIQPIMRECGLSHSWRTTQNDNLVTVTCIVTHVGGHSEQTSLSSAPDTSGGKNSIQAIASAVSYLERYTLFAILGLASAEFDDDGQRTSAGPTISDEQLVELRDELDAAGRTEADYLRFAKLNSLDELPAKNFAAAVRDIRAAGRRR